MKLESMSKNIVNIMWALSLNEGLARLLVYDSFNPFDTRMYSTIEEIEIEGNNPKYYIQNENGLYVLPKPELGLSLIKPNSKHEKISPKPFNVEAQIDDDTFIRVYYNQGQFNDNEVIVESEIIIDIVCARSLWLVNENGESKIRVYEIAGRVVDILGRRSLGTTINLNFQGFQHLYVNGKFDCLRLYCNYMSVES